MTQFLAHVHKLSSQLRSKRGSALGSGMTVVKEHFIFVWQKILLNVSSQHILACPLINSGIFWVAVNPAHSSLPFSKLLSSLRSAPASCSSLGVCTSTGLQFSAEICKPVPLCVQLLPVKSGFRRSPKERTGSSCSWQPIWHPIFKKHKFRHIKLTLSITIHYKKSFLLSLSPQTLSQIFLSLRSLIYFCWRNLCCYHLQGHHHVKNPGDHYHNGLCPDLIRHQQRWHR